MNKWRQNFIILWGSVSLFLALLIAGCTTEKSTTTARTGTEQLLLSTAADHALTNATLQMVAGRKVFLDSSLFDSYDSKYVIGTVRDAISRAGGKLQDNPTNSDVIIEIHSGAHAIDQINKLVGIPSFGLPIPLAGTVLTPEIPFYRSQTQRCYSKLTLFVINSHSRDLIYSSGALDGQSFDKHASLILFSWRRTDIPEKKSTQAEAQKFQTWRPQYETNNVSGNSMPAK
jgi:hypothetical protein